MPQMFPLLWFYLFLASALALIMMKTFIHFYSKMNPSSLSMSISKKEHNWKW